VADGIFEARHSTTIGQPIRSPVAKLTRLRVAEFGGRAPRVRRRRQPRRRVWPTAAASLPPTPAGSGRSGGQRPAVGGAGAPSARAPPGGTPPRGVEARVGHTHTAGAPGTASLKTVLRGGAAPRTAAAAHPARHAYSTAVCSRPDGARRTPPARPLEAGLTKGISFSHEYGMWLGSSHRVLADSEPDFRRPSMSIAQT